MRPTEELKKEHRSIERVLRTLIATSWRLQNGEEVDSRIYRQAVDFIRIFADKCHHAKEEDTLFPAIEKQGFPRDGGPIGQMLIEHEEGRAHVRQLAEALEKYEHGDRTEETKALVAGHATGYARLLAQHIPKEDNILYEIATDSIPPAEQALLSETFREIQQRITGNGKYEAYHRLAEELEAMTQAQGVRL